MPDLLTTDQIASKLGVKPATIRAWVFRRQIPYKKLNGSVRFEVAEIEAWIAEKSRPVIDASTLDSRRAG